MPLNVCSSSPFQVRAHCRCPDMSSSAVLKWWCGRVGAVFFFKRIVQLSDMEHHMQSRAEQDRTSATRLRGNRVVRPAAIVVAAAVHPLRRSPCTLQSKGDGKGAGSTTSLPARRATASLNDPHAHCTPLQAGRQPAASLTLLQLPQVFEGPACVLHSNLPQHLLQVLRRLHRILL